MIKREGKKESISVFIYTTHSLEEVKSGMWENGCLKKIIIIKNTGCTSNAKKKVINYFSGPMCI